MNWETIISIISLVVSVITILFFSIYPSIKKTLINKSFIRIENFYNLYSYLNPCFLYRLDERENITTQLISQLLLANGFPKFKYLIKENYTNFDPFLLQETNWSSKLTIWEILYFYRFWQKASKKLNYIKKCVNNYDYIMISKDYYESYDQVTYRNSFFKLIEESSISLCPSFDHKKLFNIPFNPGCEYKELKFDLRKIDKVENNHKFLKELKSKKFSINLKFKTNIKDVFNSSYSIIFDCDVPVEVQPFFYKQIVSEDEIDKNEIRKHLKWIDTTFKIDSKSLFCQKPYWVKDIEL